MSLNLRRAAGGAVLALVLGALAPAAPGAAGTAPGSHGDRHRAPVAATQTGLVRGAAERGVDSFLGIPFAAPPVGDLRWAAPRPPARWRGVRDATEFGNRCPATESTNGPRSETEDCLFVIVQRPSDLRRGERRPVFVFIHGGGLNNGSSNQMDMSKVVRETGVVGVTMNYRLGVVGFLGLPDLTAEAGESGNYGFQDQQASLRWVRRNVAAFGGDPSRVMLFGQSGGGAKIATMMAMPAAEGLFHRAATMSGQQVTASGPLNATARARAYLQALGVSTVDALLALPAERLVEALGATDPILGGGLYFGPVLDMKWLVRHPFWPDSPPQSNRIPMILGNTHDETRGFFGRDHPKIVGLDWSNLAERMAPELRIDVQPEWVVAEYRRLFPQYTAEQIFFAATTAGRSWRGQLEEAEARARAGTDTWVYQLDFASPVEPWRGAPHTLDIPLVFGTLDAPGSIAGTGAESRRVSEAMMDAFIAFAASGNPNHRGLPDWPVYDLSERRTMIFDRQPHVENDPRRAERELFGRVPYIQPGS